jgi:shikimate kinase
MKPVFLIGMPGAGKTWWGKHIAAHYSLPFYDLDTLIQEQEGLSIAAIFEQYGAAYFREREAEILNSLINNTKQTTIISCGGGTPVFAGNMGKMLQAGTVIYLRAQPETIIQQLKTDTTARPLLIGADVRNKLAQLLAERGTIYEKADHIFDVETLSLATFAKILA